MMRIGTDIVEVARIERAMSNMHSGFLERVFTYNEIKKININDPNYERAAGFWAAKESIVKAVGCGFRNGIRFHDIEIVHDDRGKPDCLISGQLQKILTGEELNTISLSISHCRTHAIAVALIY